MSKCSEASWKYCGAIGSISMAIGCLRSVERLPYLSHTAKIRLTSAIWALNDLEVQLRADRKEMVERLQRKALENLE